MKYAPAATGLSLDGVAHQTPTLRTTPPPPTLITTCRILHSAQCTRRGRSQLSISGPRSRRAPSERKQGSRARVSTGGNPGPLDASSVEQLYPGNTPARHQPAVDGGSRRIRILERILGGCGCRLARMFDGCRYYPARILCRVRSSSVRILERIAIPTVRSGIRMLLSGYRNKCFFCLNTRRTRRRTHARNITASAGFNELEAETSRIIYVFMTAQVVHSIFTMTSHYKNTQASRLSEASKESLAKSASRLSKLDLFE